MTESKKAYLEWVKSLNGEIPYPYNTWEAAVEWMRKREVYLELYTENNGLRTKLCLAEAKIAELRSRVEGRSSLCSIQGERDEARHENERLRSKLKEAKPEITAEQIEGALAKIGLDKTEIFHTYHDGAPYNTTRYGIAAKLHAVLYPKPKPERKLHPCRGTDGTPCAGYLKCVSKIPHEIVVEWTHCPGCGSSLTDEGDEK